MNYKRYIASSNTTGNNLFKGNSIEELQEKIDFWYARSMQLSGIKSVVSEGIITIGNVNHLYDRYAIYEIKEQA
jgi:hypothetical protein